MRMAFCVLLGIAVNFIWGLAFLIPYVCKGTDPVLLTAGRFVVYGLLSTVLLATTSRGALRSLRREDWLWALAFALAGNVAYYVLLVLSIRLAGVQVAALFVGTLPVTLTLYGGLRERDFVLRRLLLPLLLIGTGLLVLNGAKLAGATTEAETQNLVLGAALAVLALGLWTWYGVQNARYLKRRQQMQRAGAPALSDADWSAATGVCTLALTAGALPVLAAAGVWSPTAVAEVLATSQSALGYLAASLVLGVLVSWYATILWNRVSRSLPVSLAGQLVVFETLSSLLYAAAVDGRLPPAHELAAMAVIVVGVVLGVRAATRRGAESPREEPAKEPAPCPVEVALTGQDR